MSDMSLVHEKLEQIRDALQRIQRRFQFIESPDDFRSSDENRDMLDAISMMLIAIGENFKKIDKDTDLQLLTRYPSVDWKGVKGIRDVIAHGYFDIDHEVIYEICNKEIGPLLATVETMLKELP